METNGKLAVAILILVLLATTLLWLLARQSPGPAQESWTQVGWNSPGLAEIDDAVAAGDRVRAIRAWNAAWTAALATRRWEPLLAVGDAARPVGDLFEAPASGRMSARGAYHAALFRAQASGSVEGVLRAADAFAALGDPDAAVGALDVARRLAQGGAPRDMPTTWRHAPLRRLTDQASVAARPQPTLLEHNGGRP